MGRKSSKCIMCGTNIYPNKNSMCLNCLQFSNHKSTLLNWLLYNNLLEILETNARLAEFGLKHLT